MSFKSVNLRSSEVFFKSDSRALQAMVCAEMGGGVAPLVAGAVQVRDSFNSLSSLQELNPHPGGCCDPGQWCYSNSLVYFNLMFFSDTNERVLVCCPNTDNGCEGNSCCPKGWKCCKGEFPCALLREPAIDSYCLKRWWVLQSIPILHRRRRCTRMLRQRKDLHS